MATHYHFYLNDKTLDPLNACVDSAIFPAPDEPTAWKIAQARFAEQMSKNRNLFIWFDPEGCTYEHKPFQPFLVPDDEEFE